MTTRHCASLRWAARSLIGTIVAAAGCSSSEAEPGNADAGGGPGGPASVGDLCQVVGEAWCNHVEACGCGGAATATCKGEWDASCGDWQTFQERVTAGELIYDPDAVRSALAALSDPAAPCEDFYIDLGWTLRDLLTFGGILTGTVAEGSACNPPAEQKGAGVSCQPGLICHGDDEATAICKRAALEGEPCDVDGATSLCIDDRPPDTDNEFESTFDALVCIPDGGGMHTIGRERGTL